MLLGFFLPYSTGNESHLLPLDPQTDLHDYILQLPLIERIERMSPFETHEVPALVDDLWLVGLDAFLRRGIAPLLSLRCHPDLWHVIALALHSNLSRMAIEDVDESLTCWETIHIPVQYAFKMQLVEILAENLVVEPSDLDFASRGAGIHHLRVCLRSLALEAHSLQDSVEVYRALVALSAPLCLQDDWGFVLHRLVVDDPSPCRGFCPHTSGGELLRSFLTTACISAKDCEPAFCRHATSSLADAIEWQEDCWHVDENKTPPEPCVLVSLLYVARHLFAYMRKDVEVLSDDCNNLIDASINLRAHPDKGIRIAALRLLAEVFSYLRGDQIKMVVAPIVARATPDVLAYEVESIDESKVFYSILAKQSDAFVSHIRSRLKDVPSLDGKKEKLLMTLSRNSPMDRALEEARTPDEVVTALHQRKFHVFLAKPVLSEASIVRMKESVGAWDRYRIAQEALVTGNFAVAHSLLQSLKELPLSDTTNLWISILARVSDAEAALDRGASLCLPDAVDHLRVSLEYLRYLSQTFDPQHDYGFWEAFLRLRLDSLELLIVVRRIVKEALLTGKTPSRTTRSHHFLRNCVRGLHVLSSRYQRLYQQSGLFFRSSDSAEAVLTLSAMCTYLANWIRMLVPSSAKKSPPAFGLAGFQSPMASLLLKLDAVVENRVTSHSLLEILDGILRVPCPYPRVIPLSKADLPLRVSTPTAQWPLVAIEVQVTSGDWKPILAQCQRTTVQARLWMRIEGPLDSDEAATASLSQHSLPLARRRTQLLLPPVTHPGEYRLDTNVGVRDVAGTDWELGAVPSVSFRVSRS